MLKVELLQMFKISDKKEGSVDTKSQALQLGWTNLMVIYIST